MHHQLAAVALGKISARQKKHSHLHALQGISAESYNTAKNPGAEHTATDCRCPVETLGAIKVHNA